MDPNIQLQAVCDLGPAEIEGLIRSLKSEGVMILQAADLLHYLVAFVPGIC